MVAGSTYTLPISPYSLLFFHPFLSGGEDDGYIAPGGVYVV